MSSKRKKALCKNKMKDQFVWANLTGLGPIKWPLKVVGEDQGSVDVYSKSDDEVYTVPKKLVIPFTQATSIWHRKAIKYLAKKKGTLECFHCDYQWCADSHAAIKRNDDETTNLNDVALKSTTDYDGKTPPTDYDGKTPPTDYDGKTPTTDYDGKTPPTDHDGKTPPTDYDGKTPPTDYGGKTPPTDYDGKTPTTDYDGKTPTTDYDGKTPPTDYDGKTPPTDYDGKTPPTDYDGKTPTTDYDGKTPTTDYDGKTPPTDYDWKTPTTDYDGKTPTTDYDGKTPTTDYDGKTPTTDYDGKTPTTDYDGKTPTTDYDRKTPTTDYDGKTPTTDYGRKTPTTDYDGKTPTTDYDGKTPTTDYDGKTPTTDYDGKTPTTDYDWKTPTTDYDWKTPTTDYDGKTPTTDYGGKTPTTDYDGKTPTTDYDGKTPTTDYDGKTPTTDYDWKTPTTDYDWKTPTTDYDGKTPTTDYDGKTPTTDYDGKTDDEITYFWKMLQDDMMLDVVEDSCSSNSEIFPFLPGLVKAQEENHVNGDAITVADPLSRNCKKLAADSSKSSSQDSDSTDTDSHNDSGSEYMPDREEPMSSEDESPGAADGITDDKVNNQNLNPQVSSGRSPVKVSPVRNTKTKRVWDKKHCCVFCMKLVSKLPRHFERVHKNEVEVVQVLAVPKKSPQRVHMWEALRKKGDFAHNAQVIKEGKGVLITCRRPSVSTSTARYIPCEDCLGYFLAKDLWKHKKICAQRKNLPISGRPKRGTHQSISAALLPLSEEASDQMKTHILCTMACDEVSFVARRDSLIVRFGTKLFTKCGHQSHQHQYIKQKMRELARFLVSMRRINHCISSLSDCINPTVFSDVITAVKEQCQFDTASGRYRIPSLALKIGHSLKKCCKFLKSRALETQDMELRGKCDDFFDLITNEWHTEVASQAHATLHLNAFNRPRRVPLTQDIRKMNTHLQDEAGKYQAALKDEISEKNYQNLTQVTMAQLVLFNRRRGGEVERIKLTEYRDGIASGQHKMQEEVETSLTPFERRLAAELSRIEIQGKRGRKVPVLLTQALKQQVDLLVSVREVAGVSENSFYLFARIGQTKTPYRSSDAISRFANECGAERPELLQSTSLRFHVATVSQLLNLKENELDVLAGFMGHDLNIHRKFYRLPESTIQVAKVSKILVQMEQGNIAQFKGKSLDEIQLNEEETVSDEETTEDPQMLPEGLVFDDDDMVTKPTSKDRGRKGNG